MVDTRTSSQRRRIMQAVKTKDTGPELLVRSALHRAGLRYSLHKRDLPGKPDVVLVRRGIVVFVHGCFWHGHECGKGRLPKSRLAYWRPKIARNKERDAENVKALKNLGWKTVTVWQCSVGKTPYLNKLVSRIRAM